MSERRPPQAAGGRYAIVPGDPQAHRDEVLGLSFRNLPASRETSERRFRKYYERNPAGPPSFFLSRERDSGGFNGIVALFPSRLWVNGEVIEAGVNGDLAVDSEHRVFGPAMALERTLLAALPGEGRVCAYGRPNPLAEVIVERAGFADLGRMTRFVKVLRTRAIAAAFSERPAIARAATAAQFAVDPLLSLFSRERLHRRSRELSVERPLRFGDRFAPLWEAARREHRVTTERTAELLNWKYELEEPGGRFSIFALAAPDGEVAGYVVHQLTGGVRHVLDILFRPSRQVLDTLLSEFIRDSRRERATAISLVYLGESNRLTERLGAFGFLRRTDKDGLRVHVEPDVPPRKHLLDPRNWYLLAGDTDI